MVSIEIRKLGALHNEFVNRYYQICATQKSELKEVSLEVICKGRCEEHILYLAKRMTSAFPSVRFVKRSKKHVKSIQVIAEERLAFLIVEMYNQILLLAEASLESKRESLMLETSLEKARLRKEYLQKYIKQITEKLKEMNKEKGILI